MCNINGFSGHPKTEFLAILRHEMDIHRRIYERYERAERNFSYGTPEWLSEHEMHMRFRGAYVALSAIYYELKQE